MFRTEAVKQYVRSREEVILPRYVSRRAILVLWAVFAVIVAGGAALLGIRMPLYTTGTAVAPRGVAPPAGELAVSIPVEALARVRLGQPAYLRGTGGGRRYAGRVVELGGGEAGPDGGGRAGAIVRVRLAAGAGAPSAPPCLPGSCRVDIRIGAPRALAFFAPGDLRTGQ